MPRQQEQDERMARKRAARLKATKAIVAEMKRRGEELPTDAEIVKRMVGTAAAALRSGRAGVQMKRKSRP